MRLVKQPLFDMAIYFHRAIVAPRAVLGSIKPTRLAWIALLGGLLLVFGTGTAWGQVELNRERLQDLARELAIEWEAQRAEAKAFAKRTGIPMRLELGDGRVAILDRIEGGRPIYVAETNLGAARTSSVDVLWPGGGLETDLTGETQTLGIWDAGAVRSSHQEFGNRVTVQEDIDLSSHSTHVGGTMVAAGVDEEAKGMAFKGRLLSYRWTNDDSEMASAAAESLQVSNHSYGTITGWTSSPREDVDWRWWGDPEISETEDWRYGFYTEEAASWDEIARDAPHYLIVKSAGNDRLDGPSNQPVKHEVWDPDSSDWVLSETARDRDGAPDGYESIASKATAKNILSIGAVEGIEGGYTGPEDVEMSSFSGWGPTDDGRIKPDLVAKGVGVYSPIADSDESYASFSGTSMSSPVVSGSVGLLQEHYEQIRSEWPLASTIRALLLHTAHEAGRQGPDYKYGWGLLNAGRAAEVLTDDADRGGNVHVQEIALEEGQTFEYEVQSGGESPLVATIAWTDPPGDSPEPQLNPGDRVLVNDLDLRVEGPDGKHEPFVLDPSNPGVPATTGDNNRDNVEQVLVERPGEERYTVSVTHEGSLEGQEQSFSLVTTGHVVSDMPVIALEPRSSELQFGEVQVGESRTDTFSVRNVGGEQLEGEIGFAQASDHFAVEEGEGSYELAPAEKMEVVITYAPQSSSRHEEEIEVSHNGGVQESPRRVSLSGRGRAIVVEPSTIDYEEVEIGKSSTEAFLVKNIAPNRVKGEVRLGEGSDQFALREEVVAFDLGPGESEKIQATYTPQTMEEKHEGTVEVEGALDDPVVVTLTGKPVATFAGGSGTENDPYQVVTVEQLQGIGQHLDAHFVQMADIDASRAASWNSGRGLDPIGLFEGYGSERRPFMGSFDGNGYKIKNVVINRPDEDGVALFAATSDRGGEGRLESIVLEGVEVTGGDCTAGLVCENDGTVDSVHVTGTISGNAGVGGLSVSNRGVIRKSSVSGSVQAAFNVGGLVSTSRGNIGQSRFAGAVSGERAVGGLLGRNDSGGEIRSCRVTGTVEGATHESRIHQTGGIVGLNANGDIHQSYAATEVEGANAGGIAGKVNERRSNITDSYWDVEESSQSEAVGEGRVEGTTGLPTAEMTGTDALTSMALDFTDEQTWLLVENDYPALWWEDVEEIELPDRASISLEPRGLSFGFTSVSEPSSASITLENTGSRTLEGDFQIAEGDKPFSIEEEAGEYDVPPGDSIRLQVGYAPDAFARHEGTLEIRHNAANEESPIEVGLSGIGTSGTGTKEDPYEVAILEHLRHIDLEPDAYFAQSTDIDARPTNDWNDGAGFEPIGSGERPFSGSYDGRGHAISGLTIDRSEENVVGLFQRVGEEGRLRNISLKDVDVTGGRRTGGVVANNFGRMERLRVTGRVSADDFSVGGVVGSNWGKITKTDADVGVSGRGSVGGIVGIARSGATVSESRAKGEVDGGSKVGGLIGENDGTVARSFAAKDVTGNTEVGGLIGANEGNVSASYWDVEATGQNKGVGNGGAGEATGLATAEMTGMGARSNMPEFDFEETWLLRTGYPDHRWAAPGVTEDQVTVSSSERTEVDSVEVALRFFGVSGTGALSVQRHEGQPDGASATEEGNVSAYHYLILAEQALAFDSTEIRFDARGLDGVGDPEAVIVYRRQEEGEGAFQPLSTGFDVSANELFVVVEEFSEFALASDSDKNPLPVEMAGFEARTKSDAVRLIWQTASEKNNAGFEVQRRAGGTSSWEEIDFVDSKAEGGTTNEPLSYRFTDEDLPFAADRLEYRLRQVDLDGTATLTDPVSIERTVEELQLKKTFPNPARSQATVRFAVPQRQEVTLELYDVLGRQVQTVSDGEVQGRRELQVDLSGLASGMYFLRLNAEGQTETQRLTVVR